jgi:hypothetical protein
MLGFSLWLMNWLSGGFLGRKRTLFLAFEAPIGKLEDADVAFRGKGFVYGWGSAPEKPCGLGLPFVSHELFEGSLIHGHASG